MTYPIRVLESKLAEMVSEYERLLELKSNTNMNNWNVTTMRSFKQSLARDRDKIMYRITEIKESIKYLKEII